jgi:uncharacterized Zn finger protein
MDDYEWKRYVPVATRRRQATRVLAGLRKQGQEVAPVVIDGRRIASTFWGKAWCENLEHYSDFRNRLPRGRTYVRNGFVIDLQVARGAVTSLVSGSDIYEVRIGVAAVPQARWRGICRDCTGAIDSVVELLQGRLSTSVMARICEPKTGLFPAPKEISFRCSCPDWARMCKHVAAVLYGIGARLDERPELLFLLRGANEQDLIAKADTGFQPGSRRPAPAKILETGDLSEIFGIEIAQSEPSQAPRGRRKRTGGAAGSPVIEAPAPRTRQPDRKPAARASRTPHRPARAASRSRG